MQTDFSKLEISKICSFKDVINFLVRERMKCTSSLQQAWGGGHGKPFVLNFVLHAHAAPGGWGYPPDPLNKGAWCLTNGGAGRGHTR